MKKNVGFSLLELVITLAMIVLFISISFPSYQYFIHSKKVKIILSQITHRIQYARTSAIHESGIIRFCGSDDDKSCNGNWDGGQIIISAFTGKVLRHFSPISTSFHLTWQSSFGRDQALSFNALGFTEGQQGHFALYRKKDNRLVAKIIILGTGRIRIERLSLSMIKFSWS